MCRLLVIISCFLFQISYLNGSNQDSLFYKNNIFDKRIKTVQLYKEGWNLSNPIIRLNSGERLVLQFDLLDNQSESYYYTFYHCDKDWNKSDIFINDYLEGFSENPIEDLSASFNTTVNYFHYKLIFPNERVNFKLSGNYVLIVYPYEKPDEPVLTQCFIISEERIKIDIKIHRPQMTSDNNAFQQVDFTADISNLDIIDPYRNIYSFILQNGRWDTSKRNLKPDVYGDNELKYSSLSEKNIFPGGNEFRYFDIKSIKYQSEFIQKIDYLAPYYNIYLKPSENREFKPYFYWKDLNGKYYLGVQEGKNPDTDADYVNVFFTLPSKYIVTGGKMYVSGYLNSWLFNNENLMIFNPDQGQYECNMLLKQGWYNYEYVFLKNGDNQGIPSKFEGSHYETENDYLVVVYYRNPRGRYDRIIGTATTNTLNRLSY